jgi:hypothetical protein
MGLLLLQKQATLILTPKRGEPKAKPVRPVVGTAFSICFVSVSCNLLLSGAGIQTLGQPHPQGKGRLQEVRMLPNGPFLVNVASV